MTNRRSLRNILSPAGLLLALFAFTFQALLPPGFMLNTTPGRVEIVLCGGQTAWWQPGDDRGGGEHEDVKQRCPFLKLGSAWLPPPPPPTFAPTYALVIDAAPLPRAQFQVARFTIGPPLPARGPPLAA